MITKTIKLALLLVLSGVGAPASLGQSTAKEQEAKLIAILESDAEFTKKADACRELARVGTVDAVPALARLLADEQLSHMARYGLETIPGPEVDEELREALGKLKGNQRLGVIGSLGVRRGEKSVPALTGLLKDPDAEVAQAAARALGTIGSAAAADALVAALSGTPPANQPALCEGLFRCAEAFRAHGVDDKAIGIYDSLRKLPQAPHQVRAGAWRGSILARGKEGVALLLETLRGEDPGLVATAEQVAIEFKEPGVSEALAGELVKVPAERQILLANVLGARGDAAALPALLDLAKAGEPAARVAAVKAAVEIGDAASAAPLVGLLKDPDAEVAQAAAAGLAGLPGEKVDAELVQRLQDESDQALRLKLVDIARQRRMKTAMPLFVKMMDQSDAALRSAAIRAYAELAGEAELPFLLDRIVKSDNPGEIEEMERALASICGAAEQPDACVPKLVKALAKAGPAVKPALLRTLRVAGGPAALNAVRGAVKHSNKDVHLAAIRVLGEWKSADAIPALLDLARNSGDPVDKVLSLRGCLGMAARPDVPAPERLAVCRECAPLVQRDDERRLWLAALGNLGDATTLDLVIPCLEQAGVQHEAVATVMAIAGKRPGKQHGAATKEALEKVLKVAADKPEIVKQAQEWIKVIEAET